MEIANNSHKKYAFTDLNQTIIHQIANIQVEPETADCAWLHSAQVTLSEIEKTILNYIADGVIRRRTSIMNEATLWARLNYPLLQLAETEQIQAWSEVPVSADFPHVTLYGIIDGVLGYTLAGMLETPWFVIVEAKKGLGNKDPRYQLYGQILATAFLNSQSNRLPYHPQGGTVEIKDHESILYGCYTVADDWTFVRARITHLETNCPEVKLAFSREYAGRLEAKKIVEILKVILQDYPA